MPKIVLEGYIEVLPNELDDILVELPKHIELTLQEEGCLVFRVENDKNNNLRFNVYEEFKNKNAFESHQKRVKTSAWGLATKNVQRNYVVKNQ